MLEDIINILRKHIPEDFKQQVELITLYQKSKHLTKKQFLNAASRLWYKMNKDYGFDNRTRQYKEVQIAERER